MRWDSAAVGWGLPSVDGVAFEVHQAESCSRVQTRNWSRQRPSWSLNASIRIAMINPKNATGIRAATTAIMRFRIPLTIVSIGLLLGCLYRAVQVNRELALQHGVIDAFGDRVVLPQNTGDHGPDKLAGSHAEGG